MLTLKDIHWSTPEGDGILNGINLEVPTGKLTVITGPNGGGKTSLAKVIAGLYTPVSGEIYIDKENITDWDITTRAINGIAYAFQQPVRFKGLTVRDLLELAAKDKLSDEEIKNLLLSVGLNIDDYIDRFVDSGLSGGEIKRIEIATVLARKNTKVIVFDEPEAGIDLWSFSSLISAFENLKAQGNRSMVIISHQERIMEIADYIAVIADGKVKSFGVKNDILPQLLSGEAANYTREDI